MAKLNAIAPLHRSQETWERLASRRLLTHTIQVDGKRREALVYHPRHIKRRTGLPLVIVLHGGASSPESIARKSEMHRLAEQVGFLVAYPRGLKGASGLTWHPTEGASARASDDARFVRRLVASLQRHYEIDATRIFAAGFSIGGSLVYELACAMSDLLAAVAVVSGTMTSSGFAPLRPMPLIHIHGTKDRRVPVEGGRGAATRRAGSWHPVRATIERWRTLNRCTGAPIVKRLAHQGVTGYLSTGAAPVELWLVEGGGHTWPGGRRKTAAAKAAEQAAQALGIATNDPAFAATRTIWTFFAAHPRRRSILAVRRGEMV